MGFPFLQKPGGDAHINLLSEWISSCDKTHPCKQREGFTPTRLLDLGDEHTNTVKLVSSFTGHEAVRYVALSHQWGSSDDEYSRKVRFAETTSNNIHIIQGLEGVHCEALPQTFRDAAKITRSLGVRYLWIDSLCILQKTGEGNDTEHKKDWERESQKMERVFSSAYFTIAASCARHRFDGLFRERGARDFVTFSKDGAKFFACDIIDNFDRDVEQGPLNKRGWVLQERALSRRTIHFTETQTYWECGHGIRCETFTQTQNRKAAFLGDSDFPQSVEAFRQGRQIQHYQGLYERYSTLGLTNPTDRPIAIAGLEKRLLSALKSPGGYGVFHLEFGRDLLWQRQFQSPMAKRISFEQSRQVPSWSWMSFHGHIRYMNVPLGGVEWDKNVVSPFDVRSATATADQRFAAQHPREFRAPIFRLREGKPRLLTLDDPDGPIDGHLKCAVIARDIVVANKTRQIYAIIVRSVGRDKGTEIFERVGVAYLDQTEFENQDCEKGFEIGVIR